MPMLRTLLIAGAIALSAVAPALAAETGMPWEGPLAAILNSVTGPVAKELGDLAIVGSGLAISFCEVGAGLRRLLQVVLGLSITFTASTLIFSLFGVSSGALLH